MRKHTENFKNKIKEFGRRLDSKITFGETKLGNEQLNSVTPVVQSALLKSVMKELDIDSNVDIPIGTIINYKFGVKVRSGKNLFNIKEKIWYNSQPSLNVTNDDYGVYLINGTATETKSVEFRWLGAWSSTKINFKLPSGNYKIYAWVDDNKITPTVTVTDGITSKEYSNKFTLNDKQGISSFKVNLTTTEGQEFNNSVLKFMVVEDTPEENGEYEKYGAYEYLDFGDYQIYSSEKQEDTNSYNIVAYDKMLNSMVDYTTLKSGHFPISVRDYINAICEDINLTFKNKEDTFANYDKIIPSDLYADLGYTYRDVLDELAQVTASNIIINQNNEVEIKYITETDDTIDEEYLKNIDVKFGEKYGPINSIVLTRSGGSDSVYLKDDESIADNGLCEIKIEDNQIMNDNDRSDYLQGILNQLNGTEYYINDFSSTGICYYEVGDRYNVKIGDNNYSCVLFNDNINVTQGLEETIHTDLPEQAETDYTKADKTDRKINQTYIIVDKQNQKIDSVVTNVSQYDSRISEVEQTVDSISQKVENVVDLTREVSGKYSIKLENCITGNLLYLSIKGIVNLLYPATDIYPKDDLYILGTYLVITDKDGNENKINLPINYLRGLDNTYDEFIIDCNDFDDMKCYIIRRIGVRENGELYILGQETIENLESFVVPIKEGNNTLTFESFPQVNISAKYAIKNDYSDLFATRVELNSSITQTRDEIDLEVRKKVDENEIISSINQSAEEIQINANRISLKGKAINLTSDSITINSTNFNVDKNGNLTCNNAVIKGVFENYDSNNKLAIRISGSRMNFYDWQGSGQLVGRLASTTETGGSRKGITLYTGGGNGRVAIGYQNNWGEESIHPFISCDENSSEPPWIKNTINGDIHVAGGSGYSDKVLHIINGFIVDWDNVNSISTINNVVKNNELITNKKIDEKPKKYNKELIIPLMTDEEVKENGNRG